MLFEKDHTKTQVVEETDLAVTFVPSNVGHASVWTVTVAAVIHQTIRSFYCRNRKEYRVLHPLRSSSHKTGVVPVQECF